MLRAAKTPDPLSDEIDEAVRRVRAVQRKRFAVSALAVVIAATLIGGGEALIVWGISGMSQGRIRGDRRAPQARPGAEQRVRPQGRTRIPLAIFALPFVVGLPVAWGVRTLLWPKDPVI